jgi:ribose/xylose/arabinose/galactoside ABC-type transport system permease subunit
MQARKNLGILCVLLALIAFGTIRYENFAGTYNLFAFLRYNAMFVLVAIGMAFVIITGGIDLSVGKVAALSSVVSALFSGRSPELAIAAGVLTGGLCGLLNGLIIARMRLQPFIVTLATSLGAYGLALRLANNQPVDVSWETWFTAFGQGDLLGMPIPFLIALAVFIAAAVALNYTRFGQRVLAVGGSAEASRLMGLNVERGLVEVYTLSGLLAGLAGTILAAQFAAGQPNEGMGWDLVAISAVVLGGTLLSGGVGSIVATVMGALLLGLIFNLLNFENGLGVFNLSVYWQSVIRGAFLLVVILMQARLSRPRSLA